MSKELIDHNEDLQKLYKEGYALQIINDGGHILVHNVPYVNSQKEIKQGILALILHSSGGRTIKPQTHVAYFIGECPCKADGTKIDVVINHNKEVFSDDFVSTNTLSALADYQDHYQKITRYINIIVSQAQVLDDEVTAQTFRVIESEDEESVFKYPDTNTTKALINPITAKLKGQKIAIIGLGGTGSYILDLVAKTPVSEIHLFDGDRFFQHNAFRAPGAASKSEFYNRIMKVDYWHRIYSNMHKYIYPHAYYINQDNLSELASMTFIFIAMDPTPIKKELMSYLMEQGIPFVDTGIGLQDIDGALKGQVKLTTVTKEKGDHVAQRISTAEDNGNLYDKNIQIADLNALNAAFAVIKWKKLCGFFKDHDREFFSSYVVYTNEIINDDLPS